MRAMVLEKVKEPLVLQEVRLPTVEPFEVLIKIKACGVCHTDLHIVDGELSAPSLPLILGHQVVGIVEKLGENVSQLCIGDRVGVPWLGGCCHSCEFCVSGKENLCDNALYTGYLRNGGFAEYCTAHEDFILKLPENYNDLHAAPLLCAGLIGYRAYRLTGKPKRIGFYGFGSSAHLLIQVAKKCASDVYVFTRPGDQNTQAFAQSLGAVWTGGSDELPPVLLDAVIIFAPVGDLYVQGLKAVKKGGKVISAGIHMSDIPSFPYDLLWGERSMSSVANLTRQDGKDFMEIAGKIDLQVSIETFPLQEANRALAAIRDGSLEGSAVLDI